MAKCNYCGKSINAAEHICPGCGFENMGDDANEPAIEFYSFLDISPQSSDAEIAKCITDKVRYWVRQANNAFHLEERHKAEKMLDVLARAHSVLLDSHKRKNYDKRLGNARSHSVLIPVGYASRNSLPNRAKSVCPRCGLRQTASSSFCPSCGYKFMDFAENETVAGNKVSHIPSNIDADYSDVGVNNATAITNKDVWAQCLSFWGWRKLEGIVLVVEPPYLAPYRNDIFLTIIKISLSIMLLPFLLSIVLAVAIMGMLFTLLGYRRSGFFSGFSSQVISFFVTRSLYKPAKQIYVRDARLRDALAQEHLIRIHGEMIAGNINVGDEIVVEGFNSHGTLFVRRGINLRTRSEIRIRRR